MHHTENAALLQGLVTAFQKFLDFFLVLCESECHLISLQKRCILFGYARQLNCAVSASFWEIRENVYIEDMFCPHFSSSLSPAICHVCESENKFGFISLQSHRLLIHILNDSDFCESYGFLSREHKA